MHILRILELIIITRCIQTLYKKICTIPKQTTELNMTHIFINFCLYNQKTIKNIVLMKKLIFFTNKNMSFLLFIFVVFLTT